jgi:hypothetical protein
MTFIERVVEYWRRKTVNRCCELINDACIELYYAGHPLSADDIRIQLARIRDNEAKHEKPDNKEGKRK